MSLSSSTVEPGGEDQTDSGTDSPTNHKPDGLPVPLYVLAAYMRDGTWLDIRTEDGPAYRVRIIEIVVRVRGEDVRFTQEWLENLDDERKEVKRCRHTLDIDSESIWKIEPSQYHLDEVQPYGLKIELPPLPKQSPEQMQLVLETVLKTSLRWHDLTLEQLRQNTNRTHLQQRYVTMLVVLEMSDLSSNQICEAMGYRSPTPMISAVQDRRNGRWKAALEKSVYSLGGLCDTQLSFTARRTLPFPLNYSPILDR